MSAPGPEHPKPVDHALLAQTDLVVLLGPEVELDPGLVRNDAADRVATLGAGLGPRPSS